LYEKRTNMPHGDVGLPSPIQCVTECDELD
jgi:hypothetical protein